MVPVVDIARLSEELAREGASLAVLFGSQARGTAGPESDIDIGVVGLPGDALLGLTAHLGHLVGQRVDLVDLRRAGPLLAFAVAREGRPILDPTGTAFPAFASYAARRYADTAKLRALQLSSLRRYVRERVGP
jgi:predicted nucleotidyltransferase